MTIDRLACATAILIALALVPMQSFSRSGPELQGSVPGARVELACKIKSTIGDHSYKTWRVELRKSDGVVVRQAVKGTGDTAHFKDLEPGIYLACIVGVQDRERCESFDLVPPEGQTTFSYAFSIEAPQIEHNRVDGNRVHLKRLAVPGEARKELARSEAAQRRGDQGETLSHLLRAVEICPSYPEGLNNIGVYYHRQHEFERAVRYFERATNSDPDFYTAWTNLSGSLMSSGRFQESLEASKRAHHLRSNEAAANAQLAMSYYYLHDYDEAKRYFSRVQELDPTAASTPQLFLAHIAIVQKHEGEAEGLIRSFLDRHPNSPQASSLRQMLAYISGKTRSSISVSEPGLGP
jgi:Tfp pilus assembly protein PilF